MRTIKLVIIVETDLPTATIKSAATSPIKALGGEITYVGTEVQEEEKINV